MSRWYLVACAWVASALLAQPLRAEPFRYPEGKHGGGELRYVQGVPVLTVQGTPEEMGEQMGMLALKPAAGAIQVYERFLQSQGLGNARPLLASIANSLLKRFPEDYQRELESAIKASGLDRDMLVIGNTFHDIRKLTSCSAVMVSPERSKTGGALIGRNLDYPFARGMLEYSLVIVYQPKGKQPFAVVSFPGSTVVGCAMSAMNAHGLFIGQNDVGPAADQSPWLVLENTPTAVLCRQILEECDSIAAAEKAMQKTKPAGRSIFVMCDRLAGGVIEATPKTVALRQDKTGYCAATNHFETRELSTGQGCRRLDELARARGWEQLGIGETHRLLQAVSQEWWTAHSMVFEPETLKLHVAFGDGRRPATAFPLRTIDLSPWLKPANRE